MAKKTKKVRNSAGEFSLQIMREKAKRDRVILEGIIKLEDKEVAHKDLRRKVLIKNLNKKLIIEDLFFKFYLGPS